MIESKRRAALLALGASGVLLATGRTARAQGTYPTRPIRMIVPHPVGGGVDIIARKLGEQMQPMLGQPFVVDNRPGANGMLGAQATAASAPDGYTLMMAGPGEIAIAPHLHKTMAYDPFRDLQPITLASRAPNVLVVGPRTTAQNVPDLIAQARAKPGGMTFGSSGIGNIQHLNGELFNALAGTKIVHVPYKGASPQIADIVGGQIDMGFTSVAAALPLIRGGKLRALAVTSRERVPALPDVPALAETPGLEAYELNNWFGLFAPAGLPAPILQSVSEAARRALSSADMQRFIVDGGAIPSPQTPEAFRAFIGAESAKFARIIRDVNITLEN
jgi:tripartite-type tricarboxylate transporter receptor subunit TctC